MFIGAALTVGLLYLFSRDFEDIAPLPTGKTFLEAQAEQHYKEIMTDKYQRAFSLLKAKYGKVTYENADQLLDDVVSVLKAYKF